jgi:hypothetical protein
MPAYIQVGVMSDDDGHGTYGWAAQRSAGAKSALSAVGGEVRPPAACRCDAPTSRAG